MWEDKHSRFAKFEAIDSHECGLVLLLVSKDGHAENDLVAGTNTNWIDARYLLLVQECSMHGTSVPDANGLEACQYSMNLITNMGGALTSLSKSASSWAWLRLITGELNQPFATAGCRFRAGRLLDLPSSAVGLDSVRRIRLSG